MRTNRVLVLSVGYPVGRGATLQGESSRNASRFPRLLLDRRRRSPPSPSPPSPSPPSPSLSPSPSWSRPMPQLTLFGKPAAQPTAPAPAAKKAPAPSAAAPKGKAKASASRTGRGTAGSSSDVGAEGAAAAELGSAARAHAVWAAHRSSQVTGISARPPPPPPQPQPPQAAADRAEARLLGATAPGAGGSTTLERMQAQERLLVEQHVASRARLVEPKKKAYTAEAGWRRTSDGERAFVTASGKRLTGKVAHAAAKRLKS